MPNPNITPRPENLTRAGMGQPRKNLVRVELTLTPELLAQLNKTKVQQQWNRNYLVEQALRAIAGLPSDYSLDDLILIFQGAPIE